MDGSGWVPIDITVESNICQYNSRVGGHVDGIVDHSSQGASFSSINLHAFKLGIKTVFEDLSNNYKQVFKTILKIDTSLHQFDLKWDDTPVINPN